MDDDPAQEESRGQESSRYGEHSRGEAHGAAAFYVGHRDRERDVNETQESAVRVREGPHQPARFVPDVEIQSCLETMEPLENEAHGREQKYPDPPELQMKLGETRLTIFQDDLSLPTRAGSFNRGDSPASSPSRARGFEAVCTLTTARNNCGARANAAMAARRNFG